MAHGCIWADRGLGGPAEVLEVEVEDAADEAAASLEGLDEPNLAEPGKAPSCRPSRSRPRQSSGAGGESAGGGRCDSSPPRGSSGRSLTGPAQCSETVADGAAGKPCITMYLSTFFH
ncbi:hypothetical protein SAY87_019398 [Trapa incisa]|uniref:Uncharacterized protein n=1 Tax=Trapa incisa TaxID=236973 RepID=A0AAN7K2C4_9MYRT|nr:hypothetical protein SAY87_019398 [Trapa incisa]